MRAIAAALAGLLLLAGVAGSAAADEEKVLNVYNWSDYIGPDTIADFDGEYGIKLRDDTFEGTQILTRAWTKVKTGT